MKKVRVDLDKRSYDIIIGSGIVSSCGKLIQRLNIGSEAVLITNDPLQRRYGKRLAKVLSDRNINSYLITVPNSEKAKSAGEFIKAVCKISNFDRLRNIFVIAFGGGVIGDLAGFIAAVYKRGIPYVQIPTTLLAQVDSAIGGKTAVDLPIAKNLIGAFHQPRAVISDTSLLLSLPKRQIRSGLAEVIKYGVISDASLFGFLENKIEDIVERMDHKALEYIVCRSSSIKAAFVEKDEFDKAGKRALLNFGHTFGHAIEAASHYSSLYSHGEAIAIGMIMASSLACRLGILKTADYKRLEDLLIRAGLPIRAFGVSASMIYESHLRDKKFSGSINKFVLPATIGRAMVAKRIPDRLVRAVISDSIR